MKKTDSLRGLFLFSGILLVILLMNMWLVIANENDTSKGVELTEEKTSQGIYDLIIKKIPHNIIFTGRLIDGFCIHDDSCNDKNESTYDKCVDGNCIHKKLILTNNLNTDLKENLSKNKDNRKLLPSDVLVGLVLLFSLMSIILLGISILNQIEQKKEISILNKHVDEIIKSIDRGFNKLK